MPNFDDYSDHFSDSELPEDVDNVWGKAGPIPPPLPLALPDADYSPSRDSLCLNLVAEVQDMTDMEALKSRHVSRIIQYNLQRVLDTAMFFGYELPEANPFAEGQVPYLDYYSGDIRVRVNGLLRKYELHSGRDRLGDRLLTNDEFAALVHWIDYLIDLGNNGAYDDVPHVLSCINTWVQTL